MKRVNKEFCVLERDEIILYCQYADREKHDFIVYWNKFDTECPIHINTSFHHFDEQGEGTMEINLPDGFRGADRSLCRTMEEFEAMTIKELQGEAYSTYMDGR